MLAQADELLAKAQEPSSGFEWAIRYLESSRELPPRRRPVLDDAAARKLLSDQADAVADVIQVILDALGLSDEEWRRGLDVAIDKLKAASQEGWQPL